MLTDDRRGRYSLAHWVFFITPGEHSEDPADHADNMEILDFVAAKHGADHPEVAMILENCVEHKAIIDRFGRSALPDPPASVTWQGVASALCPVSRWPLTRSSRVC